MAVHQTTASWSGTGNGAYWGLSRKIGPWKTTTADEIRANSRAGGPHAGHGNWWNSFNPHPYIQTRPPSKPYNYSSPAVVAQIDFEPPAGMKIPGIKGRGSRVRRSVNSKLLIGPLRDLNTDAEKMTAVGSGVGSGTETYFPPRKRKVSDGDKLEDMKKESKNMNYEKPATSMPRINEVLSYDRRGSIRDIEKEEEKARMNFEDIRRRRILTAVSKKRKSEEELGPSRKERMDEKVLKGAEDIRKTVETRRGEKSMK
jgi:hypothetical protein